MFSPNLRFWLDMHYNAYNILTQDWERQSPSESSSHHPQWRSGASPERPGSGQHLQDARLQIPLWRPELQLILQVCGAFGWVHFPSFSTCHTSTCWKPLPFSPCSGGDKACSPSKLSGGHWRDDANPVRVAVRQHEGHQQDHQHLPAAARRFDFHCEAKDLCTHPVLLGDVTFSFLQRHFLPDHHEEAAATLHRQLPPARILLLVSGFGLLPHLWQRWREAQLQGHGAAGRHCDAAHSQRDPAFLLWKDPPDRWARGSGEGIGKLWPCACMQPA